MGQIGNLINYANQNLLNSHSSGVTRAFPKGFLDRPQSVIEDQKRTKMIKSNDSKEKLHKQKGNKSNRGGTPAPNLKKGKNKPNTALGIRESNSQFIERSISNENIRHTARFTHHSTHNKNRKGSAKKNVKKAPKSCDRKCRSETRSKLTSFSDKRYQPVQQKYALILQNRNNEASQLKSYLKVNETAANLGNVNDSDLLDF